MGQHRRPLFDYLFSFLTNNILQKKIVDFSEIQTQIARVEGEHADHYLEHHHSRPNFTVNPGRTFLLYLIDNCALTHQMPWYTKSWIRCHTQILVLQKSRFPQR